MNLGADMIPISYSMRSGSMIPALARASSTLTEIRSSIRFSINLPPLPGNGEHLASFISRQVTFGILVAEEYILLIIAGQDTGDEPGLLDSTLQYESKEGQGEGTAQAVSAPESLRTH